MNSSHIITIEELPGFTGKISQKLTGGDVVSLIGEIGAGKTSFMFHLVRDLGIRNLRDFSSPTFTILNRYEGASYLINHIDLYRLNTFAELEQLDLLSLCEDVTTLTFVEWGDKFSELKNIFTKRISFEQIAAKADARLIRCEGFGD